MVRTKKVVVGIKMSGIHECFSDVPQNEATIIHMIMSLETARSGITVLTSLCYSQDRSNHNFGEPRVWCFHEITVNVFFLFFYNFVFSFPEEAVPGINMFTTKSLPVAQCTHAGMQSGSWN